MKICYLGNPNDAHVRRWVRNLAHWGYDVHLVGCEKCVVPVPPGVVFHDFAKWSNLSKVRFAVYGAALFVLIRKIRPDVLHAHTPFGAGWPAPAAFWQPMAVSAHGSDLFLLEDQPLLHRALTRLALWRAKKVLCVSHQLRDKARVLGIPESKLEIVYLGIDTTVFHPAPPSQELIREFDLGQGPVFYFCRVLEPLYKPMLAAQAFCQVLEKIPSARLIVPLTRAKEAVLAEFKNCLQQHNSAHAVRYLEHTEDDNRLAEVYRTALASISLAGSDGVPQALRESMACATPVIAGDIPVLRANVRDGHDTLLVSMDSPDALARAMLTLVENTGLRDKLSKNAAQFIRENVLLKSQEKFLRDFYQRLAAA